MRYDGDWWAKNIELWVLNGPQWIYFNNNFIDGFGYFKSTISKRKYQFEVFVFDYVVDSKNLKFLNNSFLNWSAMSALFCTACAVVRDLDSGEFKTERLKSQVILLWNIRMEKYV